MLSVLERSPFSNKPCLSLILKKYSTHSCWFYCKVFARPFVPASRRIIMQAVAINLSYALTINSKSLPTHPNIHLFINFLLHACSFMPSCFVSISRTQNPLFQNILIPELTPAIFLLHVQGVLIIFSSDMKRTNFPKPSLSIQYYPCKIYKTETNKRQANSLMSSKRSRQG